MCLLSFVTLKAFNLSSFAVATQSSTRGTPPFVGEKVAYTKGGLD